MTDKSEGLLTLQEAAELASAVLSVSFDVPSLSAMALKDSPSSRSLWALSRSNSALGLPSFVPRLLAERRPAHTRSRMSSLSNSAIAPITWKSIFPAGVEVSTAS